MSFMIWMLKNPGKTFVLSVTLNLIGWALIIAGVVKLVKWLW